MKKILCLYHFFPYPPIGGGSRVGLSALEYLSGKYRLDMVSLETAGEDMISEFRKKHPSIDRLELVTYKRSPRFLLPLHNLIGKSYYIFRDYSREYFDKTKSLLTEVEYDYIFIDRLQSTVYAVELSELIRNRNIKCILLGHNVEFNLLRRFMDFNPLLKCVLLPEYLLLRKFETSVWNVMDRVVFISDEEKRLAQSHAKGRGSNLAYCFPSSIIELTKPVDLSINSNIILHVGTGHWPPNADGLWWFLTRIFPKVKRRNPEAVFMSVGKDTPYKIKKFHNGRDTIIEDFVEDVGPYYEKASLFVVPLRYGAGIKIKVLDALSRGLPVVCTSVAAEGIPVRNGDGVLYSDDENEIAEQIVHILRDWRFRVKMGQLAHDSARELAGLGHPGCLLEGIDG